MPKLSTLDRADALAALDAVGRWLGFGLAVDAPLLGAAELAFEPLLANPAAWTRPAEATA